jgi:uncharacterized protein
VRNLRLRPTLPVPAISAFPEINVRTYVSYDSKPGVYFFSLDAANGLAVAAARRFYRLPYFRSRMSLIREHGGVRYGSERIRSKLSEPHAEFRGFYRPVGDRLRVNEGTLEHWLTERYCVYTLDQHQRVQRGEIHHPPWTLQRAEAAIELNTVRRQIDVTFADEPLLHYAKRQDVVFWRLARAGQ